MADCRDNARPPGPTVCLVVCYFGKLPGWIDVFLWSCAYNPTINVVVFTDQEVRPNAPRNVQFVHLLPSAFEALASDKLGITIKLHRPLKLGDFKPVYGLLFEDYLRGWDYWGYTDLDVIFGDVRRFLTALQLNAYDVFTARREYLVGHFTLFRNNEYTRTLFRQSDHIPALLQSDQLYSFDECGKQWARLRQGLPLSGEATCDSMMHVIRRAIDRDGISAHFSSLAIEWPELFGKLWRIRWRNGKLWLVDERREYMYFHFHSFKRNAGYRRPCVCSGDTALEMSVHGITGCVVEQPV